MVKAVIFDLFETLVTEYDPNWQESDAIWSRLDLDREEFWREWHLNYSHLMHGKLSGVELLRRIVETLGKPADSNKVADAWQSHLAKKADCLKHIQAGILHCLKRMRERGFRLGVLSNAAHGEVDAWPDSPLAPFLHQI